MIWTNKGLKKRVAELEAEVTSLNVQLKEVKFSEQSLIDLCNEKHALIIELGEELIGNRKTSPNVVVPPVKPVSHAYFMGQNLARALRGKGRA